MVIFLRTIKVNKCEGILAAINSAIDNDTEVVLEQGIYHIHQSECIVRTYNITNSTPEKTALKFNIPYDHHPMIAVEGKKNVVIDGQGSKIICHGKMTPFYASRSENVVFKNFTVDYADPTVVEMECLEINPDNYVVRVHPDSKYRIENGKIIWYGENFEFYDTKHYFHIYHPKEDCMRKYAFGPMGDNTATYEDLGGRVIKIHHGRTTPNPYEFVVGGIIQLRDGVRDECGSFFGWCKDVVMDNITMHFMHGLGIVAQCSENITLNGLRCTPDPVRGRICSCFADGCQVSNCRGQINITNCVFRGLHDDPVNIHGTYMKITDARDNEIVAKFIQPDSFNFNIFREGDTVEVSNPEYMLSEGEAKVLSAELIDPYHIKLTLDKDAEAFKPDFVIENVSATPDVYISGCHSSRVTTKGFLASTRGKVVIENNTFVNFRRPCVLIANDALCWYESGPAKDITIRNNLHIGCTEEPIYIFKPENTRFRSDRFVHNNILIENNRAEGSQNAWLYAKSTNNLVFRNNESGFIPLPPVLINCGKIIYE